MRKIQKTLLNVDSSYVDSAVKVEDHCHITGKYRHSAHRDCNINV